MKNNKIKMLALNRTNTIVESEVESRRPFEDQVLVQSTTALLKTDTLPQMTWRSLVILAKLIPISVNPNYNGPLLGSFGTCTSPSRDVQYALLGPIFSIFGGGGRPSGPCNHGQICWVSKSRFKKKAIQKGIT